jgi:hypothetical protein
VKVKKFIERKSSQLVEVSVGKIKFEVSVSAESLLQKKSFTSCGFPLTKSFTACEFLWGCRSFRDAVESFQQRKV